MHINQRKAGVILSYAGEIVKILVNLVYTPIMLRLLGQSEYGLYQLVYSVVSYLSLLSLGFGSSYLRFYSRYKAQNDEDGVAKLNGMFILIFCSISVICILCGTVMVRNIRTIFGTGLTESEHATAKVLMELLIINLALTFPNSVFNCSITAHEKFLFQKLLILLQNLFSPFLTLPLLIMGYGSIGMVSVTTLLTFVLLISNMFYCFKKLHVRFAFHGLKISLFKEMWVFTFFIFLNQIIDQINWSVDKFLLGRFAGTTAVAVYGVGGQINTLYLQFSSSVSNVFVPKVNRIVAETNDNTELTTLFTKVGRIQFIVLGLILTGFVFFGMDEEGELRLSDAFVKKQEIPNLEVIVKVKNINMGNSRELFEKCRPMRDYMIFVDKVRRYSREQPLEDAVERTIRECMEEDVMADFLKRNRAEGINS